MRFSGLDHVGFTVSSLDRSVPFYTALLGEEPLLRKRWDVEYVGRVVGYPGVVLDAAFWRLADRRRHPPYSEPNALPSFVAPRAPLLMSNTCPL